MAILYKITNRINGKMYIGITTRSLEERFAGHLSAMRQGSKFRFHSAIRKYGVDCWVCEILEENDDLDYIRKREEELISQYNTTNSSFGYNAKPGGCGGNIVKPENYDKWYKTKTENSIGEKNPRHNGISNQELYKIVYNESIKLGYIPTFRYLQRVYYPKVPKSFSKFRFGGKFFNLVKLINEETGLEYFGNKKQRNTKRNYPISIEEKSGIRMVLIIY